MTPLLLVILFIGAGMKLNKEKVVCFGDSITYGAKVNRHSWVYLLNNSQRELHFLNEGRNGRKTSDRGELIPVIKRHRDAGLFLIFLGVNDLKDGNDSLVAACVSNMRWMIGEIRRSLPGAKVVILSPPKINLGAMSALNVGKKYNEKTQTSLIHLEEEYRELALRDSVGFISLLNAVSPENYADGLHPDSAGQEEIAKAVWRGLERYLGLSQSTGRRQAAEMDDR